MIEVTSRMGISCFIILLVDGELIDAKKICNLERFLQALNSSEFVRNVELETPCYQLVMYCVYMKKYFRIQNTGSSIVAMRGKLEIGSIEQLVIKCVRFWSLRN